MTSYIRQCNHCDDPSCVMNLALQGSFCTIHECGECEDIEWLHTPLTPEELAAISRNDKDSQPW